MGKKQDFKDGSYGALWVVLGLVFVFLIGIGIWFFRVQTSDIKGGGDATIVKNSAANRIVAQEKYVSLMNEVKRADRQLDILALTKDDSDNAKTRYVGGISYCLSVVADYDKLSEQYRSTDFIPAGYPQTISQLDPTTDCKEN